MIYIGNDVVSLVHPLNKNTVLTQRYLDKSYSSEEQTTIVSDPQPIVALWRFWSCKEAAYKVLQKMQLVGRFNPKTLLVRIENQGMTSTVTLSGQGEATSIHLVSFLNTDSITSIASNDKNALPHIQIATEQSSKEDESEGVRLLLKKLLTSKDKQFSQGEVIKTDANIPYLLVNERLSEIEISLSHDYGIVSAAYLNISKFN